MKTEVRPGAAVTAAGSPTGEPEETEDGKRDCVTITPQLVAEHGLSEDEYRRVREILGREPTVPELGVFSAMWSEHCGYKNSRPLLKTLPVEGPHVIQGPGENAGVIAVGEGLGVAFKIESHNHPSAVEPYQGAATGVGGILRDVFTMGARPIAVLDSLHFGSLDSPRSRYLLDGVVRGVGDYGNCIGVPTVGGETVFDPAYERNPLVNVMCLGLLPLSRLIRGTAEGAGNTVMAVGARTGRDGIHGATFASVELSEQHTESRPQVQVGDPFTEKLLLEASLELIGRDLLVGIQDMGAAGLTSSATEMAARTGSGIEIDVSAVPVREVGMTAYEILLSESQERMLVVVRPGKEDKVREVLQRWDLQAATVGRVTEDGMFRVVEEGNVVVEIPVDPLTHGCPSYTREGEEDPEIRRLRETDVSEWGPLTSQTAEKAFLTLLDSPSLGSHRWIWEQYDTTVQTSTVAGPGGDAAVLRIGDSGRAVSVAVDGNGRYVYLEPRVGARIAVAEAARNVACTGARPVAITNCLNFGSPLGPGVYYQLQEAVAGIGETCRALGTPVTGGNVSLHNETAGEAVYPTPVIGMVGLLENLERRVSAPFRVPGSPIFLAGRTAEEIGGSEYLAACHGRVVGRPPALELEVAARLVDFLVAAADGCLLQSAHDCSAGGLAIALAECAMLAAQGPLGVQADVLAGAERDVSAAAALFGESQSRVVLTCEAAKAADLESLAQESRVPLARLGVVRKPSEGFRLQAGDVEIEMDLWEMRRVHEDALPRRMREEPGLTA